MLDLILEGWLLGGGAKKGNANLDIWRAIDSLWLSCIKEKTIYIHPKFNPVRRWQLMYRIYRFEW